MTGALAAAAAALRSIEEAGGAAGIAIVTEPGGRPQTVWVPDAPEEPAFLAYSITKTFIATLVVQLEVEGRLDLEDRLERWFPSLEGAERISLRHLLTHTAGIPDYGASSEYHRAVRDAPSEPWTFERFLAATLHRGLAFEPGALWAYANPGYMLLTRIVERVGGASLASLVGDRIATPHRLERTSVVRTVDDLLPLAPAPSAAVTRGGAPRDVRGRYHPGWVSHGVVASTPSDLARFYDALFDGRIVPRADVRRMQALVPIDPRPVAERPPRPPWRDPGYGLGLMGDPAAPFGPIWGHEGGGPGYGASAFHAPDLGGVTVAAMVAAGDAFDVGRLVFEVLEACRSTPARPQSTRSYSKKSSTRRHPDDS